VIALHDAAVLMNDEREHHVFNSLVFQTKEFKEFQQEVLEKIAACDHVRTQDKITDIAPDNADCLDTVQQTSTLCCRRLDESNRKC
jgi:hypothetical protein